MVLLIGPCAGDMMFFDDRLATVLRHRAAGENAARTQFRQLLDLLGNRKYGRDEALIAAAWLRLGALGEQIKPAERARIISEPGWRFRSPELAAHLAEDEPEVAAAALARAQLEEDDWVGLIPRLPIRARGFLRLRKDLPPAAMVILERLGVSDRGLPMPVAASQDEPVGDTAAIADDASIGHAAAGDPVEGEHEQPSRIIDLDDYLILRDDQQLPEDAGDAAPRPVSQSVPASGQPSEIAALVDRINRFQRARSGEVEDPDLSPRLPLEDTADTQERRIEGFGFATDTAGRIEWADSHAAPMVIGKRLVRQRQLGARAAADPLSRAFAARQPIETALTTIDGAPAITGEWIVDAEPRFNRSGGRFEGYVGRFRRLVQDPSANPAVREGERVRQLLHELRTPVNALQGFAEVIQQQLFGPAPHEYRALAANIASDAARILSGFDELERLARLESGAQDMLSGTSDIAALVARMAGQLQPVLAPRMAGIETAPDFPAILEVAVHEDEAEALVWRLLATLAGIAGAGETLLLDLKSVKGEAVLTCDLPERLRREEDIFTAQVGPGANGPRAGLFGAGFSLRLASAEAAAARGRMTRDEGRVKLILPLASRDHSGVSDGASEKHRDSDESEDSEPAREAASRR
ncbi:sensor histidine kinase [Altererythrobacter sp. GH1-8]|uniref:sensor histidine kinase n=1 Tax=Altererythrobacter sp. GH1-8 TaxID=3349333 RepID=UPI00374DE052